MAQGIQLTDPNKKKTKKKETVDLFYNGNGATYGSQISTSTPTPTYTPVIEEDLKTTIQVDGANPTLIQEPVKYGDVLNASDPSVTGTSTGGVGSGIQYGYYTNGDGNSNGVDGAEKVETGDGDKPTSPPEEEKKETPVISYAEWVAEQKRLEEQKRQDAYKEAELYKERASADAQASYAQNMSTYGINAENMAKMGLTGGGYSDYLNAQAYAQKRGDLQAANAQELALKQKADSTYEENIATLDKGLLDYQLGEEKEQATYKQEVYNALWEAVQDPNTTYTAEGIKAMGEKAGLSEPDITTLTNMLNTTKNGSESGSILMSDVIKDIQDGGIINKNGQLMTWDEIKEMLLQARNAGENVTDDDIENAKKAYDVWNAYAAGDKISMNEYYNALNGDENAQKIIDDALAVNDKAVIADLQTKAKSYMKDWWNKMELRDHVVNVNSEATKANVFGSYKGTGNNATQDNYVNQIIADSKAGKIKEGQVIIANYGESAGSNGFYIYVGDGKFVQIKDDGSINQLIEIAEKLYLPDGYKFDNSEGEVLKK